jgi:hypothetical protein
MRLQVPVANFVWYLALFLRTIDDGHVALAAPTEARAGGSGPLTESGAAASAPTKAGASGMGPDRTVSFWRGPDRSGSDLAVGHWAPIESVVNDDGPDKSVQ